MTLTLTFKSLLHKVHYSAMTSKFYYIFPIIPPIRIRAFDSYIPFIGMPSDPDSKAKVATEVGGCSERLRKALFVVLPAAKAQYACTLLTVGSKEQLLTLRVMFYPLLERR
jgi:hypothetical protein